MLDIKNLEVEYTHGAVATPVVRRATLHVPEGAALALIGESGSGKSTLALAVMRMIRPPAGRIADGEIFLDNVSITAARHKQMRSILRHRIGFIPQDPTTSLDPLFTIGSQVAEVLPRTSRGTRDREPAGDAGSRRGNETPAKLSARVQRRHAAAGGNGDRLG